MDRPNQAFRGLQDDHGISVDDVVRHMCFVSAWTYVELMDDVDEVGKPPKDPGGYFLKIIDCRRVGLADCSGACLALFCRADSMNRGDAAGRDADSPLTNRGDAAGRDADVPLANRGDVAATLDSRWRRVSATPATWKLRSRPGRDRRAPLRYFKALSAMNRNYPERVWRTIIINAPSIFGVIWSIASPLLDPNVREKITVLRADYRDELRRLVDPANLPTEFGGDDETPVGDGPEERQLFAWVAALGGSDAGGDAADESARAATDDSSGDGARLSDASNATAAPAAAPLAAPALKARIDSTDALADLLLAASP